MKQNNEEIMLEIPKHRAFTYKERKINRMSKDQVLDWAFIKKLDREKIRYWINDNYGKFIGDRKLKQIMLGYELEMRNQINQRHHDVIDNLFDFKEIFQPLEMIEVLAIHKNAYILNVEYAKHHKVTSKVSEDHLLQSIHAHVANWNNSMKILEKN